MKLRNALLVIACAVALSAPAAAQSTDPYAAGQKALLAKKYQEDRADLLHEVENIAYAVGCHVFSFDTEGAILRTSLLMTFRESSDQEGVYFDDKLAGDVDQVTTRGLATASRKGACAYFQQNPDVVHSLREMAQMAEEH